MSTLRLLIINASPRRAGNISKRLELIRNCDALIIGSPTYWGNMPGTLKLLLDRLVPNSAA